MKYLLLFVCACGRPPKSTELAPVAAALYQSQDDKALTTSLVDLEAWLDRKQIARTTPFADRSWTLQALEAADVAKIPQRPERPLTNLLASGVAYVSDKTLACHAFMQTSVDHAPIESTAKTYERSFVDDAECFAAETCNDLHTQNAIHRQSAIFEADLTLFKNYHRVSYADRRAIISRAWTEQSFDCTDGPAGNQLWQSFSMDVWIERGAEVLRFQAVWAENELYLGSIRINDSTLLSQMASATYATMTSTDTFLAKRCPQ